MAILKDLIVHGSSRFLNKIYAEELETSAFEAESAIIKKLKADDVTVVGLLDVQGQLHTSSWTNSNIATIDGSFYITPTIGSDSGNIVFSSVNVASLTGNFTGVDSLYIGGSSSGSTVQWTSGSKVLLTGEVEVNGQWLPLGTLLGTLSANAQTSSIGLKELKDNRHNDSSIITDIRNAIGSTSLDYRNLKISLYQRKDGNDSKPLGIYMTAMGANGKTFIDIYGGVNATTTAGSSGGFADPNLRIGNLSGLGAVEGTTPTGWGIYTTNGYFKGVIVSSAGKIGNFTINSALYSNNHSAWNSNVSGIYINNDGISGGAGGKWWLWNDGSAKIGAMTLSAAGVLTVPAANVSGELTAATINGSKITAGDIAAARIQTNLISAINAKVSDLSALTATIGGFKIESTSIHTNNVEVTSNADNSIALSSADFTRTINSTSRSGLRFAIGDKFGITGDGAIYASSATISGNITATSLTLGSGVTIGYSSISNPPTIPTTVAELTDSGSYLTTSAASTTYATQTNLNNEINARKAVYGTSSTNAGTATKAVTCSNFALYTGASVTVTFSKTNTSSAPQLNVNSTGAKPIKSYTGANLTEGEYKWAAGASITFTYDGTNWRMQDGGALQAKIDAASSASTASSQAGVATQQATNATNAKTAAESAKTAAQSAKTAAETASSQASSAKDTAVSAKNDAVSAKTDAETAKGQAQTAASNASQSATNAANSATAAAEVMGGFTILWNYSAFGTSDNGEGYLCAFDPATGTKSDANGWVKWNGVKRTITKQMINPNTVLPYNIPIYVVCRLSSATATTGTNYMVWYNSGWKYAVMPTPSAVGGSWTWADNTDIILGKFVETASEAALTEYEIYNPPYTSKQITTNVVTAQSASASAASAAQTATSYITYINATDGIKIHNASDTSNYLQLNSSAINFYRNSVETLKIEDSAIRVGKIGENEQNVYIADGAVQIRDNEDILAKFGSDGVVVGDINNLNIKITNDRMIMYSKSAPSIQLITGDDVRPVTRTAFYATFPFSTVTTKTYIVDSDANNFFKYSTGIKALFDLTDNSNTVYDRRGCSFTFGTSASKTMSYDTTQYTFSCSCTIEYDGAYTFIIKNWTYSNLKRVNFYIEYDLEEAAPNVILGTTDAVSFGAYSVTEGDSCQAGGENSHAEGSFSKASGENSHAEGSHTTSNGVGSHAEGYDTQSNGRYSHAQNFRTIAASNYQTAIGKYNISDSSDVNAFIIGNGESNSQRSNALTVDWSGNLEASGNIEATGDLNAGGNSSIGGNLTVTGSITSGSPPFLWKNLVSSDYSITLTADEGKTYMFPSTITMPERAGYTRLVLPRTSNTQAVATGYNIDSNNNINVYLKNLRSQSSTVLVRAVLIYLKDDLKWT